MTASAQYYFFIGSAGAAVLTLFINAFAIVFAPMVKQLLVSRRMNEEDLERRIPARSYRCRDGEGEKECSVCLSAFSDGQRVRQLQCGHGFHASCIDKWLRSPATCPICRADVFPSVRV
ncbi:RING-H2 finger protein ATL8 [Phalaenopsis equestris]|uniref:RING-H2 finger protein ATL8 n=1 Tax=Phalaenopsis equestris TaxID=78828 RepID=UPI0009E5AEA0|nr:RING-H2 finger protein ATL8 [Phalaenopsis equestris]